MQIQRFDRESLSGFVDPSGYLMAAGVELLSPGGTLLSLPYEEIKMICFVRDLEGGDVAGGLRREFLGRPKTAGLWVRLDFRDGDRLEGMMPNSLVVDPAGFGITPPDTAGNVQRVFVPRAALRDVQVLGVVGSPLRRVPKKKAEPGVRDQISLFE